MKFKPHTVALFFATAIYGFGQDSQADTTKVESDTPTSSYRKSITKKQESADASSETDIEDPARAPRSDYLRPNADKRFKNYVNNVAGPFALVQYAGKAALLTGRNSPKEWGVERDGFGRRFANEFGKGSIINTTTYGMDEMLKVDSRFYRSRDRSLATRPRNSVFSAVTARNRRGERVIGFPRIAGSFPPK